MRGGVGKKARVTVTLGDPTGAADDAGGPPPAGRETPVASVRGETIVEVEPEIVTLLVAVNARAPGRRELIEALSLRNEECLALVRSYADAIEKIQTSRLSVAPEPRAGRPEKTRLYRGSVRTRLTVRDFSVLGELVSPARRLAPGDGGRALVAVAARFAGLPPGPDDRGPRGGDQGQRVRRGGGAGALHDVAARIPRSLAGRER